MCKRQRHVLGQVYESLQDMPRWQKTQGADFIFWDPHPGFALGSAGGGWKDAWCHQLQNAVQLIPDYFARKHCSAEDMPHQMIPVPYVRLGLLQLSY